MRGWTSSAFITAGCAATPRARGICASSPAGPHGRPCSTPAIGSVRSRTGAGCLCPSSEIVQDVNRFLRGWSGYFRYGNSARLFDKITTTRGTASRGSSPSATNAAGVRHEVVVYQSPDRLGLINLNGTIVAPRPNRPWRPGPECRPVKNVGEPCAGEPHARFDVAAGGNQASRQAARPRRLPPTLPRPAVARALAPRGNQAPAFANRASRRRAPPLRRTRSLAKLTARPDARSGLLLVSAVRERSSARGGRTWLPFRLLSDHVGQPCVDDRSVGAEQQWDGRVQQLCCLLLLDQGGCVRHPGALSCPICS